MMKPEAQDHSAAVDILVRPSVARLRTEVHSAAPGLDGDEQEAVCRDFLISTRAMVSSRVIRVLILEYHARSRAASSEPGLTWPGFLAEAGTERFWSGLESVYPALRPRVEAFLNARVEFFLTVARRLDADRRLLGERFGCGGGLRSISTGLGDSHRGGTTVSKLVFDDGCVYYKPRSLGVDEALAALLRDLHPPDAEALIRVPEVVDRGSYGWSENIDHSFCADESEEARFYRGIGAWAAVMTLLRGSDLHLENLIASGPTPVIIDCEALLTPTGGSADRGDEDAAGRAERLANGSILRSGLLPWRSGDEMPDMSALGGLGDQQPTVTVPLLADPASGAGPRIVHGEVGLDGHPNRPTPRPRPEQYCEELLDGYREYSTRIDRLVSTGEIIGSLSRFGHCELRAIARPTQLYADLIRSLWHPASLHDPAGAVREIRTILHRERSGIPDVPTSGLVETEIAELVADDVPTFHHTPSSDTLTGHGQAVGAKEVESAHDTVRRWQEHDRDFDELVIRTSMASAYRAHYYPADGAGKARSTGLSAIGEPSRGDVCADLVRGIAASAIRADDGTAAWITVSFVEDKVGMAPSGGLYGGQSGICVALAAYDWAARREIVPEVDGVAELLVGALAMADRFRQAGELGVGGYHGWGARLWSWLTLGRLGVPGGVDRALECVEPLAGLLAEDEERDLIGGAAGAIVPIIELAAYTGNTAILSVAERAGESLLDSAVETDGELAWPTHRRQEALGGFAHGSAGIGWALGRLGVATGDLRWTVASDSAFRHSATRRNAAGSSSPERMSTWCHGLVGAGLAAADLHERTGQAHYRLSLAECVSDVVFDGTNNDTLCHGDLGAWELHAAAVRCGLTEDSGFGAKIVSSIAQDGPRVALAPGASAPGLMDGAAGVLFQLLRMADSRIPSALLLS